MKNFLMFRNNCGDKLQKLDCNELCEICFRKWLSDDQEQFSAQISLK